MEAEDLNREASCQIWCGVVKWKPYEMNRLGQTITNDPNSGVTEGWGKVSDKVHRDFFPNSFWLR